MDSKFAREFATDEQNRPLLVLPPHWRGLDLGLCRVPAREERGASYCEHPLMFCALQGQGRRQVRYGTRTVELSTTIDGIELSGRDYERDGISWDGLAGLAVGIQFTPAAVKRLFRGEQDFDLETRHEFFDPRLSRLMRMLLEEAQSGAQSDALYTESLSCALIALLVTHYGRSRIENGQPGGFSIGIRHRIVDFIEANLGDTLSIAALAEEAGMSPHHFARCFTATFHEPPHRFVQKRRIEAARTLLRHSRRPIAEIAHELGFTDQSHFTRVFRQLVGATPGQLRSTPDIG